MSNLVKGSAEWFAAKKKARQDLDTRLALGLPHSSEPVTDLSLLSAPPKDKPKRVRKPKA